MSLLPSEYFNLGVEKYEANLFEEAIEYYDQAIALAPEEDAVYYHCRALARYYLKQYEAAIADFDDAIRINPDDATAFVNRGDAAFALEDYDAAITDYDEAIQIDPDNAEAYNSRGDAFFLLEDYDAAIADYDEAIRIDPGNAEAYNSRGNAFFCLEDYDAAMADFDEAIRIDPGLTTAYTNRGDTHYMLKQYNDAIANYDKAIRIDPDFALAYTNRGDVKFILGDFQAAIEDYNEAIRIDPDAAAAYYGRGNAFSALGNTPEAAADYEEAVLIDPSFTEIVAEQKTGKPAKILDVFNQGPAVLIDPKDAPTNIYPDIGEAATDTPFPPHSALVRSIRQASAAPFPGLTELLAELYAAHPAPFLFRRVLLLYADTGQLQTLSSLIDDTCRQCRPMQLWLQFLQLHGADKKDPLGYFHALALATYYMGDPIEACRLYEQVLDDPAFVGAPLNMMGQYYFIESAKGFHEPFHSILECALEEMNGRMETWVETHALSELYYAGLILYSNGRFVEADDFFASAEDYLPAAYMRIPILHAMEMEPDLIEASIARLRAREAELLPGEGYLQGFPKRFLKTDSRNYFAGLQHYAHYREIREALVLVNAENSFPERYELWDAFDWQQDELGQIEWQVRRHELGMLCQHLPNRLKTSTAVYFGDQHDAGLQRLEAAVVGQLEQDAWSGALYDNFQDFQRSASPFPDVPGQLAALMSSGYHLDVHTKMLLVEYFYLRGGLPDYDALLLCFYIDYTGRPAVAEAEASTGMGKKLITFALNPITVSGQALTAGIAGALVGLYRSFALDQPATDQIDSDITSQNQAGIAADYEKFEKNFLHYLNAQRETLGADKFDEKYPLKGFYDWSKKRR